jgi:hypothetical protein
MKIFFVIFVLLSEVAFATTAVKGEATFVAKCHISGVGYSDNSFAQEFEIYRNPTNSATGYAVIKSVLMTKKGPKLDVQRSFKHFQLNVNETGGKKPMIKFSFPDGAFSEDYLSFEIPGNYERFSQTFPLMWGAHSYYCSAIPF